MKYLRYTLSVCLACILLNNLCAQWSSNPVLNTPVSTFASIQQSPALIPDGAGGTIICWNDFRSGNADIYAQRLNSAGVPQWTTNGVLLCDATGDQRYPHIVTDGAGGAIICWYDARSGNNDIYTQRVSDSGTPLWTANGVALCTEGSNQINTNIASDSVGGAIVVWSDSRPGSSSDIYIQRVNASGVVQWTVDGVGLCTAGADQMWPYLISDGASGAVVTWYDWRGTIDIYARRIDSAGVPLWAADGIAVCNATGMQFNPTLASDGAGNAVITWTDNRVPGQSDVYAQKVSMTGVTAWASNGVVVSDASGDQTDPWICADGLGGTYITFRDNSAGAGLDDIYVQRLNSSGASLWTADGVAVCSASGLQIAVRVIRSGSDGAIIGWVDMRSDPGDIYAQMVNLSGVPQWTADGVAISIASSQQYHVAMCEDGVGGAILSWSDDRSGTDIYAQNICRTGDLGADIPLMPTNTTPPADLDVCTGNSTTLYASGGATMGWYSADSGGVYLGGGNSFTTPPLTADTVYYVQDSSCAGITARLPIGVTVHSYPIADLGSDITDCISTLLDAGNPGATYLWNNGAVTQMITADSSGTYIVTVTNSFGCADSDTINVTIGTVNTGVSLSAGTLTAAASGAVYQWIDCDAGGAVIPGETAQDYSPSVTGNYAVIVTEGGCTDTSACTLVLITSLIHPASVASSVTVFPNPASGEFTVSSGLAGDFEIVNMAGQVVNAFHLGNDAPLTQRIQLPAAGIYTLRSTPGSVHAGCRVVVLE